MTQDVTPLHTSFLKAVASRQTTFQWAGRTYSTAAVAADHLREKYGLRLDTPIETREEIVIEPIVGAVVVKGHRYVVLQANSLYLDLYCDDNFIATYPILADMPEIIRKHSNASR